jgi:hypothetical protein
MELYGHYNKEAGLSLNERELEERKLRSMVQINYLKMLFLAVINLGFKTDYEQSPELRFVFDEINKTYETFIILYFQTLYSYTMDPMLTVYIASFCLREEKIKALLVEFAKNLTYNDFEKLSGEINRHFGSLAAEITTYIANHANLYNINACYLTIDEILNSHLQHEPQINQDDREKIKQIQYLFKEGKVEKVKLLKFILKLNIGFLKSNKFVEAAYCDKEFSKELDIDFIFGKDFRLNYSIMSSRDFIALLDKNSNFKITDTENKEFGVYVTIVFTQSVIRLYYNYLELCRQAKSDKLPLDKLRGKKNVKRIF